MYAGDSLGRWFIDLELMSGYAWWPRRAARLHDNDGYEWYATKTLLPNLLMKYNIHLYDNNCTFDTLPTCLRMINQVYAPHWSKPVLCLLFVELQSGSLFGSFQLIQYYTTMSTQHEYVIESRRIQKGGRDSYHYSGTVWIDYLVNCFDSLVERVCLMITRSCCCLTTTTQSCCCTTYLQHIQHIQ